MKSLYCFHHEDATGTSELYFYGSLIVFVYDDGDIWTGRSINRLRNGRELDDSINELNNRWLWNQPDGTVRMEW